MSTGTTGRGTAQASHEHINALRAAQALKDQRRKLRIRLTWVGVTVAVIAIVAAMMLTSRQQTSSVARVAPDFTLTNTAGATVSLSGLRGKNVLLYFSEGAGCEACLVQMNQIENDPPHDRPNTSVGVVARIRRSRLSP